jgi:hypothetical protein
MYSIKAYPIEKNFANIEVLSVKRNWMDQAKDSSAYNCFPLTLANTFGFAISFPVDISFELNKKNNKFKIYSGEEFCYLERGLDTISFITNIQFETEEGVSLLTIPPPNYFIDGMQCFTSILSTSFFTGSLHIVYKITKPNHIFTIKAGTPIAAILPISISQFKDSVLIKNSYGNNFKKDNLTNSKEYSEELKKYLPGSSKTANWYKKAVDHKGNKIGNHELLSFNLKVENKKNV